MSIFNRRKGVDISYDDGDNFQRNLVSVRTVTYTSGVAYSSYSYMYRRQPAIRAAVDFLARNIAQLNPKVYSRLSTTDRLELPDHPLAELLHYPNVATTRYRHQRDTIADIAIYDRAYWRKLRMSRGRLQIVRIPPVNVTLSDGVYRLATGEVIPRGDLVVFAGYSPEGDDEGVSPLETLRRVLAEEMAAVENREGMWRNSTRNGGVIERPETAPEWSDLARERFRADWEGRFSGATNSGRVPVLEEGMRWNVAKFDAPATDYIAGRRLTYEEAAIAYGIPPSILGVTAETNQNVEQFHRQVYQDVLGPYLRLLQDEIELQLLPEFEPFRSDTYVEFNIAEKLKGSFEEQATTMVSSVGVPYMTVNEGRSRLNLPSIKEDWADQPVQPLNVMYGGQPAVTVPTATPATPLPPQEVTASAQSLLAKHFVRLAKAYRPGTAWDADRWDRELAEDLRAAGLADVDAVAVNRALFAQLEPVELEGAP